MEEAVTQRPRDKRRIDPAGSPNVGRGRVSGKGQGRDLVKRRAVKLFALAVLGAAWAASALPATAGAAGCPNESFRGGLSALLPECRAYEMVSPPDKANGDVESRLTPLSPRGVAGLDEDGYAFLSYNGLPGSENGALLSGNVAKRGSTGWTSTPFAGPTLNQKSVALAATSLIISRDLNKAVISSLTPLTPEAQPGENLYVRTLSPPSLQLITPMAIPVSGNQFTITAKKIVGASDDFSHIFFESHAKLTPDSPELGPLAFRENLYEWNGSTLTNVGTSPGETEPPSIGILGGGGLAASADGQRVVFESAEQELVLRDHGTPIDPAIPAPGVVEPFYSTPEYGGVSRDISSVFFRSRRNLTTDAFTGENSSGQKNLAPNLYRYDVETGALTDLTVDRADERGADVNGKNVLVAPDGEAAFFVAGGVLAPGATVGASNLYRWSADGIEFIGTLDPSDPFVTVDANVFASPEASANNAGDAIAFVSVGALTQESPVGVREIYRWSKGDGLTCASCDPDLESPAGDAKPAPQILGGGGASPLSADGSKVFFSTTDPLVSQDTNGRMDAYEWVGGTVHLISTGAGNYGAEFLDASPSTKDVFFVTRDQLVAADRDENTDVYDAREGGGFAEAPLAVPCEAEACRPPLEAAPQAAQIGSRSFNGPVNTKPHHKRHRHHKKRAKHHKKRSDACKAKTKRCPRASHHGGTTGKRG